MSSQRFWAPAAIFLSLSGCVQNDTEPYTAPEQGDPQFLQGNATPAGEPRMNSDSMSVVEEFRRVFIARADLSKIKLLPPEVAADESSWKVTAAESDLLRRALVTELSDALEHEAAYDIVVSREQGQVIIHTTIMAIRLYANREQGEVGARANGAITASFTVIDVATGDIIVRSVDTRSSNNIRAFQQVKDHDPAINFIFGAWGNSLRRGLLHLQGRKGDTFTQPAIPDEKAPPV